MTIAPIETRYAGCRFRSRLESRWAVFFDALGIRWEYEPQGYVLPSGPYLPDFQLFGLGGDGGEGALWFEVKPQGDEQPDDGRWTELSEATGLPLILARGMPRPDGDAIWPDESGKSWMEAFWADGWDNGRAFCFCPECGRLGIAFMGYSDRVCVRNRHDIGADKIWGAEDERILAAYAAARSARFEHGESGA